MRNDSVKISVVMPSLNVRTYIAECIDSALNQTLKDIEILCVDAGSTDGTLEILQEYAQKDGRVKIIHSDIKSYGHQMNLGLDAASGKYMAILETDDYIEPDMYEVLYNLAEKNKLDLVKGDYEIFLGEGDTRTFTYMNSCRKKKQYNRVVNPSEYLDIFNARMNTWTGIYNIDFLRVNNIRHNETPGASYQDNGFWFQTFMFAKRIMFVERPFYKLRRDNPNSSVHNRGKVFCIFEEYEFIENIMRADKKREQTFAKIFQKKKFDNCQYHYGRVGDEFKMEFLERMSKEFGLARDKGELDEDFYIGSGYRTLTKIIDYTEDFYSEFKNKVSPEEKIKYLEKELSKARWELNSIKSSKAYKFANMLAFVPRKIRGGIQCYKDNGLKYTLNRIWGKITGTAPENF